ncbi:TRAP transporter substrate-binding protein DctP, partial [bacterium]|nr:TRAP transporter substrate-binding protein DctP [candidate division CSSED10-310 bacterium]
MLVCAVLSTAAAATEKETVYLKIATLAPEGSVWMDQIAALNTELDAKTNGQIRFKVYPGGIMGDDDVVLRKIRVGQLDGAMVTTAAMARIKPEIHALAFPGLFKTYSDVDWFLERKIDTIGDLLRPEGYEAVGIMGLGFTYMFTQNNLDSVDDLKKAKGWLWDNDVIMKTMYSHAGITPVSIGISDVMTALQTGLLDTVFNTPTGILSMQWFNRVNRMIDIPLTHAFGSVLLSRRGWDKVSDDLKPVV